jgi:hypothetical protein
MTIVRHNYAAMSPHERETELRSLQKISCRKNNLGVSKVYIQEKFDGLIKGGLFGENSGVQRAVTDIFVLHEKSKRVAFAIICAPGQVFHRLRAQYVRDSVFLALLCGNNANVLMNEIVRVFEDKWITADSLSHVIGYYLRPQLGNGYMIDTRRTFWASDEFRATYNEHTVTSKQAKLARDKETKALTEQMAALIKEGEPFVPRADSSTRRSGPNGPNNPAYVAAHIVIPPKKYGRMTFDDMCYTSAAETGQLDFLNRSHTPDPTEEALPPRTLRNTCTGANCAPVRSTRRTGSASGTEQPRAKRSRKK